MPEGPPRVLIAAVSGRALAQAARRDGYAPLVADLFGDDDTRAAAEAHERLPGGLARGMARRELLRALARLAEGRAPEGLVYGSGFESRPGLLARLGQRYALLGNSAEAVRKVKNPVVLAEFCARLEIPHPEIRLGPPPDEGWMIKRIAGAGGAHVRKALAGRAPGRGHYVQRQVPGEAVSALFLANGTECRIFGFSEQWAAPLPRRPFRYGGAARPARIAPAIAERMAEAVSRLTGTVGLIGLNAADFLATSDGFHLLEVNPRPGATLDLFARPGLFQLHLDGCRGTLPSCLPAPTGAAAVAVVYARRPVCLPPGFPWPDWAADRQPAGVPVPARAPLCTVRADARDTPSARALALLRAEGILDLAEEAR